MQKLVAICIRQPIFAAMIILALVVVGAASYMRLGVDRFPSVDLPTVRVLTTLPGASPEEIESQISQRLEDAINTVEGISQLWSISGQGSSIIIITYIIILLTMLSPLCITFNETTTKQVREDATIERVMENFIFAGLTWT